ncbi:MAG: hypothetical protein R3208_18590 [Ketobacteraceae bacterium]|nr:hypothetical protein [Ketobacteraceae bacterium]
MTMHLIRTICLCLIMLAPHGQAAIVVIVNPDNPTDNFSQRELVDLYMGRNLYFPDGNLAVRLDQAPTSEVREAFYRALVDKSVAEVNAYWARLLFTGRASPPQVLDSSDKVINAVLKNRNAIGYIEEEALVDSVKVVGRVD